MFPLRKWVAWFRKRASKRKPPQKEWKTVDPCIDDDGRKEEVPRMPQKGPEHFIPFPKR